MTSKQKLDAIDKCERTLLSRVANAEAKEEWLPPDYLTKSLLWLDLARVVILTKDTVSQLFKV